MSQLYPKYAVFMSLACRFYVMFMSFMLILYERLLLDIQSFTALIMSYVIKYGHFSFQIPILELGCISEMKIYRDLFLHFTRFG